MVPVVGVDHASTTAFATETHTLSPGLPFSVPVSRSTLLPEQLGSASDLGLETPLTVSDHSVHAIVVANYWSFSTCLWPPIDRYHPRCPMP